MSKQRSQQLRRKLERALQQSGHYSTKPPRPFTNDRDAWCIYWQTQSLPWRIEPEISLKRQQELACYSATAPDIENDIYPFSGIILNRADIEWLLATHENGRGPIDWSDEHQRSRKGLDVRGANLCNVDLSGLPLARLHGGITRDEIRLATQEQCELAGVLLKGAKLNGSHLEGASLHCAHLEDADLIEAHLENAYLPSAHLEAAMLRSVHLEDAWLGEAHLERAFLERAHLQGTNLGWTHLEGANLQGAKLENGSLFCAKLGNANLSSAQLNGNSISHALMSNEQQVGPLLADIHWGDVNLGQVKWEQVKMLGDEYKARKKRKRNRNTSIWAGVGVNVREMIIPDSQDIQLQDYETAVRANRQLAVTLQGQGLNEDAARFFYRAQVLQKSVFRFQIFKPEAKLKQRTQALGPWLFSWFLYLLAGYGYKMGRSFLAYLLVISTFMALYLFLDPHLAWYEAIIVSMTAFHGRGFSPSTFSPGDPLSIASAVEAFVGLIIEVTFISTLTRRFFGQ